MPGDVTLSVRAAGCTGKCTGGRRGFAVLVSLSARLRVLFAQARPTRVRSRRRHQCRRWYPERQSQRDCLVLRRNDTGRLPEPPVRDFFFASSHQGGHQHRGEGLKVKMLKRYSSPEQVILELRHTSFAIYRLVQKTVPLFYFFCDNFRKCTPILAIFTARQHSLLCKALY